MSEVTSVAPSFTLPENPRASARYRARFNKVAKETGVGVEWVKDDKDPLVVNGGEIKITDGSIQKYGSNDSQPKVFNPQLAVDIKKVLDAMEARRLGTVEASSLLHKRIPYRAPLENLNKVERRAVELFAREVKPILDRIEARQHDPNADKLSKWIASYGDYHSKKLFDRFHRDTCAGLQYMTNDACSLLPFYPDQPPINGMIDPKISAEDFKNLGSKLEAEAEELRPTTILSVVDEGGKKIVATPLPLHPDFKADHLALARALTRIAFLEVDLRSLNSRLRDQLFAWAKFFRTGDARDEAKAVQATIDAGEGGGNLRVHIGPSESYWDDNTKFPYLLQVGVRDPELSKGMSDLAATFLEVERSLRLVPHYTPRNLSVRGSFADPFYQAIIGGFIYTFPVREPMGNNFPNYAGYHAEGGNRFIMLESVEVSAPRLKNTLSAFLDEDVSDWDSKSPLIFRVVNHESGHLLGPQRNHVTPSGKTMGAVFGAHWGDADEPKADLTDVEIVRIQYLKGAITRQEAVNHLRALVAYNFGISYRGKSAFAAGKTSQHSYGNMIEVGHFFKTGAYSIRDGKFHVDYDKLMTEASNLWRKIIAFQAAGDVEGFLEMGKELVSHIPDRADKTILEANKNVSVVFIERHL